MTHVADLILTDAKIRTLDPDTPFAEALAVKDGRIIAVGRTTDIEPLAGKGTTIRKLAGAAVLPGLIDSHTHGLWGACRDLFEAFAGLGAPLQTLLDSIAAATATTPAGQWVIAAPWRPFERPGFGPRPYEILDRIAPNHPVAVKDVSEHNLWLNSAALRLAGITADTPEVPGGHIERDVDGTPTGILIEAAISLVQPFLAPTTDQLAQAVRHMTAYFHSLGITGFKEPMAFAPELQAYADADLNGTLALHVGAHLTRFSPFSGDWVAMETLAELRARFRSPHLHTEFAKLFLDGVPIARTAAFCAPYPGEDPTAHVAEANLLIAPERLNAEVTALDAAGYTVKMHAVGDRAVQAGLDAIAAARRSNGASGYRHEIAHANFIRPEDLPRFATLDAVAEVSPKLWFPNPITPGQRAVLGDARVESCHPIRALLDAGARVVYASDWPAAAADADPWVGLAGMISRKDPFGQHPGSVGLDQAIPMDRALPLFTREGARALRLENTTGVLKTGASAEMIVLERPPEEMPVADLARTRPLATYFEGRLVHEN